MSGVIGLKATRVYEKITEAFPHYRVLAFQGGTRSSKTFSILQKICIECFDSLTPLTIVIGAKTVTWAMRNIFPDFKKILEEQLGCWDLSRWNGGKSVYNLNGSTITFVGFDTAKGEEKAHGLACDICFLNEANFLSFNLYRQLLQRCRMKMIIDFNPGFGKRHWLMQSVLPNPNCYFMRSTYKDNPFLTKEQIETITGYEPNEKNIALGTADETFWKIYGKGEMAVIKGLVYPNFTEVSYSQWPSYDQFEKFGYGLDFGFSNDPSALADVGIIDGNLYMKERLYEAGLVSIVNEKNPDQQSLENRFAELEINKQKRMIADCARPEMIQDLRNCGYRIYPSLKGPGSVLTGINCVKMFKLHVHESSYNLMKEITNYKWKEDRNGEHLPEPVDRWNHCFVAGTRITTRRGQVKIEDLSRDDMILTRDGYKSIDWTMPTREKQEIWELTTTSGIKLQGTGDHKIFIGKDKIKLSSLRYGDMVYAVPKAVHPDKIMVAGVRKTGQVKTVYNLQVADCHEYFANGILVANCLDAVRYKIFTDFRPANSISGKHESMKVRTGIEKFNAF